MRHLFALVVFYKKKVAEKFAKVMIYIVSL